MSLSWAPCEAQQQTQNDTTAKIHISEEMVLQGAVS